MIGVADSNSDESDDSIVIKEKGSEELQCQCTGVNPILKKRELEEAGAILEVCGRNAGLD
jgi:hypothetical protein